MRRESPHFVCLQPGDKKRYVGAKFGDCGVSVEGQYQH